MTKTNTNASELGVARALILAQQQELAEMQTRLESLEKMHSSHALPSIRHGELFIGNELLLPNGTLHTLRAIIVGGTDRVRTVDFVGTGYQLRLCMVAPKHWLSVICDFRLVSDHYLCKHETKAWGHFIETLESTLSMPPH